ncbi:5-methylcytosine-specific restriction related enzyme [Pseudoalteromonas luteoviolacea B = ATCC 29581]|nr:5-methylcytosine-specific restriction related enzyme [Pseudoalteromonas luteoviolacea B = ATCC 29581]
MSIRQLLAEIAGGWVQAKNENFTGHPIANLLRRDLIQAIETTLPSPNDYLLKASAGAGNWADVPWLSILNPAITESTQSGIYPVYLFRSDGSGIYLSLGFGTTELRKQYGTALAKQKAEELRNTIRGLDNRLDDWGQKVDLRSNTTLGQSYEWASAGAKFYPLDNMPDDNTLTSDLKELLEIYADVNLETNQNSMPAVKNAQLLSKPFLLLAGISGTGKTRFVREQAKTSQQFADTYCLTSVRPDWHEPSDLLGYISRLNGPAEYITTDVLKFIAKAWRAIEDSNLTVEVQKREDLGKRLVVSGERAVLEQVLPYWLCLDEMNLAPVEQYFADYLSVLETREWHWQEDSFTYSCDALLKPATIEEVADKEKLRKALGFKNRENKNYDELWQLVCQYGLSIPFNLLVAGTVNMDETTHGFSRKVIDRALSFDFGEFFPNNIDEFFAEGGRTVAKRLSYPVISHAKLEEFKDVEADNNNVLVALMDVLETELNQIWPTPEVVNLRPDLLQCKEGDTETVLNIPCRSKTKLEWMNKQLNNGFCSFWP